MPRALRQASQALPDNASEKRGEQWPSKPALEALQVDERGRRPRACVVRPSQASNAPLFEPMGRASPVPLMLARPPPECSATKPSSPTSRWRRLQVRAPPREEGRTPLECGRPCRRVRPPGGALTSRQGSAAPRLKERLASVKPSRPGHAAPGKESCRDWGWAKREQLISRCPVTV